MIDLKNILLEEYNNILLLNKPKLQIHEVGTVILKIDLECVNCLESTDTFYEPEKSSYCIMYNDLMDWQAETVEKIIKNINYKFLNTCNAHLKSKEIIIINEDDCFTFPWYLTDKEYLNGKIKIYCICLFNLCDDQIKCNIIENKLVSLLCSCPHY